MAAALTDNNFETEVYEADVPVLVDFYADWCGPCKAMGPVIDALAREYDGKIKIGKINVDDNQETAAQFGVMSIPTFIIFKGKDVKAKLVGMQDKKKLKETIDSLL